MSCIIQEIIKYFEQGRDDLMDEADKHAINTVNEVTIKKQFSSDKAIYDQNCQMPIFQDTSIFS